jgi:sodium/potassium/calcium exchanger 6
MNYQEYGCERNIVESIRRYTQKNIIIQEYCSEHFTFLNLVDIYYRSMDENAILIFLFICAVFPLLFMCIATIADKYLATGMTDLSKRFKLSPSLAAMTLIAFANGAPDILATLGTAGKEGGSFIAIGSLFGGFVFSCTLVVSNVIWNSPGYEVKLPKFVIMKEMGAYFASVLCVIVFGLFKTAGYSFVIAYVSIYVVYVLVSLYVEKITKKDEKEDIENDKFTTNESLDDSQQDFAIDESKEDFHQETIQTEIDIVMTENDLNENELTEKNSNPGFMSKVVEEMLEDCDSLIEKVVIGPLKLALMFTNCYLDNPFMIFPFKFLIIASSFIFMVFTLELLDLGFLIIAVIGLSIGALSLTLELLKVNKFYLEIFYQFLSIFAAIGWISIFSGLVIDFIAFLAFYFSINEVILSSLLLSAGNTVGDFFGNGALAKKGEYVMALVATYSGQIFNNFIGFAVSLIVIIQTGTTEFDIFALDYGKGFAPTDELPPPYSNYFLMIVILFVLITIIFTMVFYFMNQFVATNKFTKLLFLVYLLFFIISLIFGIISRKE